MDETGTRIFTPRRDMWTMVFVAISDIQTIKIPMFSRVVLIANTLNATVRTVAISTPKKQPDWNTVESAFPIGDKMNEQTHIFDGSLFTSPNETSMSRFFMTALPVHVADSMANTAVSLFGNIHKLKRIDTMEHILFQYYGLQNKSINAPFVVIFPQGDGLRILHVANYLPLSAKTISNHSEFREKELFVVWDSLKENAETSPKHVVILKIFDGNALKWLFNFFEYVKIKVEEDIFDFAKFINIKSPSRTVI